MMAEKRDDKQPYYYYDKRKQEHKYGYTVNAVHIFNPLRIWLVRIPFFYIQIFCKLSPNAHV